MDTKKDIELRDKSVYPDDKVLRKVLDTSYESYSRLLELYNNNDMSYEWRYYHDGKAWLCKVQRKKRTIVWMSAWMGYVQAAIYFPEKYLDKLFDLKISERTKNRIKSTKNVGKSKPCIFEIRGEKIPKDFEKVMKLKIECK